MIRPAATRPASITRSASSASPAGPASPDSRRRRRAAAAVSAAAALALSGCGSVVAGHTGPAPAALPELVTSSTTAAGTSWAVAALGGSPAQQDNFWQLFVRPAGASKWRQVTPAGVADNGGLVAGVTGPSTLVTGFRPSQDLTFSPLAVTANGGASWSPGGPVDPGLADVPDALAAGPAGQLLALTSQGAAELGHPQGATWTRLISTQALARTPAGRACGLTMLTAAAFSVSATATASTTDTAGTTATTGTTGTTDATRTTGTTATTGTTGAPGTTGTTGTAGAGAGAAGAADRAVAGTPMLAGRCTRPGTAGIFALRGGSWQAAGPVLPAALTGGRKEPAEVLRMLTLGPLTEALLEAGAGPASTVLAAWSSDGGAHWRLSPPLLATTSTRVLAASFGADGATGLVLAGGRGEAIAGPGAPWRTLPPLPRGTAVLAIGPDGRLDALTAHVSAFADWQLEPGLAGAGRWSQQQQLRITIPYGSSG